MATITINTEDLSADQIGVLLELISNDTVSTNGDAETVRPSAAAALTKAAKAPARVAAAPASTKRRVVARPAAVVVEPEEDETELLGEDDESELLGEGEEEETEEEAEAEAEEDEDETVTQAQLERMSLADVKAIAKNNGLGAKLKPNMNKAAVIAMLIKEAGI
jgi:hypothetical protein